MPNGAGRVLEEKGVWGLQFSVKLYLLYKQFHSRENFQLLYCIKIPRRFCNGVVIDDKPSRDPFENIETFA